MENDLKNCLDDSTETDSRPLIYSWGRADTNALLRSPNEYSAVDSVQKLGFANQRTILQVRSQPSDFNCKVSRDCRIFI